MLLPLDLQNLLLALVGILLVPFLIGMSMWSRKLRQDSGWALLEERYPQKDKFRGEWQINKQLRFEAIRGWANVDVGTDVRYLYLRPTRHNDLIKRAVQIPWSAIDESWIYGNVVQLMVAADKRIVLSLDCASLSQVEEVIKLDRSRKIEQG